jgi:hypothetical protein
MMNNNLKWGGTCQLLGASGLRQKAGEKLENSFTAAIPKLLEKEATDHG